MCNVAQSLIEEGRQQINCLYSILMMEGAFDKMQKALSDDVYLEKLLVEYASQIDEKLAKKMVV